MAEIETRTLAELLAAARAGELPPYHPGVPDGHIEADGERVVYDYDENGELVGWHKEPQRVGK